MKLIEIETFEDVRNYLDYIPYINSGGCAIAALAMYRWLIKNGFDKKIKFHFLDGDLDSFNNNKKVLYNKSGVPEGVYHVGLYFDNKTIDCGRTINIKRYKYKIKTSKVDFLIKAINNVDTWCYFFDRKRFVPQIAKALNIDLSDVALK